MTESRGKSVSHLPPQYSSVHWRLRQVYGSAPLCIWDDTHEGRFEWANVSGDYTANIEDYLPMCLSCHRKFDVTDKQRAASRSRSLGNTYAPRKAVAQTLDGSVIATYPSVSQASRVTGTLHSAIFNQLAGRAETAGGFTWVYLVHEPAQSKTSQEDT